MLTDVLQIAPEVAAALATNKPIVALESTVIAHGLPRPQNLDIAFRLQEIVRDAGAVPATVAILDGKLRVGLNDNEVAAAMEPFRTQAPSDQASDSSGVSLSLTKALVEANRAQFHIKTGPHLGTLIEVVFAHAMARA